MLIFYLKTAAESFLPKGSLKAKFDRTIFLWCFSSS